MDADRTVVVIGGGVGGLVAAARLTLAGHQPLLLERSARLGGRFSTIEQDGYKLPTGAVAIETTGPFWETFAELGIDPGLRVPDPPVMVHVRGHDLTPGAAVWEHMMKSVTKAAGRVAEGIGRGRDSGEEDDTTLEQWVRRYTRSKTLLSLFQALSASIFTVNADELPAGVFFRLLRETGGYKHYGFAPQGNVAIADLIAADLTSRGAEIRRGWEVRSIEVEGEQAVSVSALDPNGQERSIECSGVVSNAGPLNTATLLSGGPMAGAFAARVRDVRTTSLLALAFTSEEELVPYPGIWVFTDTRRMCNLANLTATCPELAPPGRKLYEAYAAPRPSIGGQYDADAERALLEADLRDMIPGYAERADVVMFKAMRGLSAPAQQCVPGHDLSVETPIPNLVEVGDGVKPYGWIGTTACAQTARLAVDALLKALDLSTAPLTAGGVA